MRARRSYLVMFTVTAVVATSFGIAPADAKVARVTGGVRCTISDGAMTFTPGLRYREHIEGFQKGRGPAATTFGAELSGCTAPAGGAAPGGIDHGALQSTGKVRGSYCEKLDGMKLLTTITWRQADDTVVGKTVVKLGVSLATPGFDPPWTFTFQNSAKANSTVFHAST